MRSRYGRTLRRNYSIGFRASQPVSQFGRALGIRMRPKWSAGTWKPPGWPMPMMTVACSTSMHSGHQYISSLAAAGIHPKIAQQLARHSTIGLTMDRYTHLSIHDVTAAIDRLPGLPSVEQPAAEPQKATGTDGRLAHPLAQTADSTSHQLALVAAGSDGAETGEVHDGVRFVAEWHPSVADLKMRLLGLEPRTYGLKVRCSTN